MSRAARPVVTDVAALFSGDAARTQGPSAEQFAQHAGVRETRDEARADSAVWDAALSANAAADTRAPDVAGAAADGETSVQSSDVKPETGAPVMVAQDTGGTKGNKDAYDEYDVEDYDPWERFNEKTFNFNVKLDRYVLKRVAKVWDKVLPDQIQIMISNAVDNAAFVPRFMNSLLQGKWDGAMRELGRFMLNSTVGVGGLFDIAKQEGIEKSREDFGQTLGYYGAGPGPYIVVPFVEPLTVRDGIGKAVDMALDPLGYLLPFIWERLTIKVTDTVNDRSLNLELYQGFEETTIDLYSAVRHAYLQRRQQLIKE